MGTVTRPELSIRNKYYIPKHRYYELKHYCMQYDDWCKELTKIKYYPQSVMLDRVDEPPSDRVCTTAIREACYTSRINGLKSVAKKTDPNYQDYILLAVTKGYSYDKLRARYSIPCSSATYYELYRKFFWLLDQER